MEAVRVAIWRPYSGQWRGVGGGGSCGERRRRLWPVAGLAGGGVARVVLGRGGYNSAWAEV